MADSLRIFEPGWQARDANGLLSGAFIDLFLATTTTNHTAYSDSGLTSALPNPIVCNSAGFPTSDGNTPVTVWVGTQDYRVRLRRADGTTVWDFDNQPGAQVSAASQQGKYIGEAFFYLGLTAPDSKCLFMNGNTIGSASSGATARASDSADTVTLYTLLWNTFGNTEMPIQDSSGTPTTRGASAALDLAANKRLPLLDACGRALLGLDSMGGISSKNRLTGLSGGLNGDTPGATGGVETHTLTEAQMAVVDPDSKLTDPTHAHNSTVATNRSGGNAGSDNGIFVNVWWNGSTLLGTSSSGTGISFSNIGSGSAHNNVQPSIAIPSILIYAGAA